jgi:hypothetical protein
MRVWVYVKSAVVAAALVEGFFEGGGVLDPGLPLGYFATGVFAFGVVGMLLVIGIQYLNPRSDAAWTYPQWAVNPLRTGQPLQFFYFAGYFFLAGGLGGLLRAMFVKASPLSEPVLATFTGAGVLVGVWSCTRVFRKKMAPRE